MYVRKGELRLWREAYEGEKCKWHTFDIRVRVFGMPREEAIQKNKLTRKIGGRWKIVDRKDDYNNSGRYTKVCHIDAEEKRKKKPDYSNIVSNKYEAEVILREYERMLDKLENTVCYTSDEQAIKDKQINQLNTEYNTFYNETIKRGYEQLLV